MAEKCTDPVRKAELVKIADVCDRVPAEPPRDFWEAVQSVRFMHLAAWKESSDRAEVPVGRIDQFWYPYYKADIESGKITRDQAAELIGAMWLKIREVENLVTIKREHRAAPGSQLPNVTLCGRDKDGNDLTNELSWMVPRRHGPDPPVRAGRLRPLPRESGRELHRPRSEVQP